MSKDADWPKRPDGSNMTVGEMSPEQAKLVAKRAVERLAPEFKRLGATVTFEGELKH